MATKKKPTSRSKASPAKGTAAKKPPRKTKAQREREAAEATRLAERKAEDALLAAELDSSDTEKVERNSLIFRAWLRGSDTPDLAETFQLDESTVRRIIRSQKAEAYRTEKLNPLEVISDHLLKVDAAISELASVAATTKGAVRVTAVVAKLKAYEKRLEMLQTVGFLPHDLGTISVQLNGVRAAEQIIEILDRYDVPEDAALEIEKLWDFDGEAEEVFADAPQIPEHAGAEA